MPPKLSVFQSLFGWQSSRRKHHSLHSLHIPPPSCTYLCCASWFLLMLVSTHRRVCVLSYLWQLHSTPSSKPYLRFQTSAGAAYMHKMSCKFILLCQKAALLLQKSQHTLKPEFYVAENQKRKGPSRFITNTCTHTLTGLMLLFSSVSIHQILSTLLKSLFACLAAECTHINPKKGKLGIS